MVRSKASAELAGPLDSQAGLKPAGADFNPSGPKVSPPVKHFKAPKESFEKLDAEAVAALVASAGDIALVLDVKGVIRDLTYGNDDLPRDWADQWIGRSWLDTVTVESRIKVEAMLRQEGFTKWDEIELDDGMIEVDDAIDASGKKFDLKLDPKTLAIVKRKAE